MDAKKIVAHLTSVVWKELVDQFCLFSDIMLTSKGRDKLFSLVQYIIDLYIKCMSQSVSYRSAVKKGHIASVAVAKKVKQNISSGRKVFKFMKSIDMYTQLIEVLGKDNGPKTVFKQRMTRYLQALIKFLGIFYYLLDNIVWIANMGAIKRQIIENQLGWRQVKDMFALLKNVCESLKNLIKLDMSMNKLRQIERQIEQVDKEQRIGDSDQAGQMVFKLIIQKHTRRSCFISVFSSFLSIIQLSYRLKFKPARRLYNPIFVILCRITSIVLALIKIWQNANQLKYVQGAGSSILMELKANQKIKAEEQVKRIKKLIELSAIQKTNLQSLIHLERLEKQKMSTSDLNETENSRQSLSNLDPQFIHQQLKSYQTLQTRIQRDS